MTDKVFYVRISREPRPGCACGLFHSIEAQQTWADRAAELTRYGAGMRGTMTDSAETLRAQVERDRRAVNVLRHIAHHDGNAVLVKLSTVSEDVMDLLTRDMLAYCREHNRFSVTMVGYAVSFTWTQTEAALTRIEQRIALRKRLRDLMDRQAARRTGDGG